MRRKYPIIKRDVFAVHLWETADGKTHQVTVWDKKGRAKTIRFKDWEDAESYAQQQAKRLGIRSYQVDTPSRPHIRMKLADLGI